MASIFKIVVALVCLPTLVIAQSQADQAVRINALSRIDRVDGTGLSPVSNGAESTNTDRNGEITISDCELTIRSVSFVPSQGIWEGLLTTINLSGLEIEQKTTLNGTHPYIYWPVSDELVATAAFGIVQFFVEEPGKLFHFSSANEITPSALSIAESDNQFLVHSATFHNERNPTEEDISSLVSEILTYQDDYCQPEK
ncbi:hypothetical protein [Halocynthiibacter sp.]|uniref:hypothetical protein n=1 Tax=Halocynthiibacter sp. TaxID=1979210 RepID=UPI003C4F54BC